VHESLLGFEKTTTKNETPTKFPLVAAQAKSDDDYGITNLNVLLYIRSVQNEQHDHYQHHGPEPQSKIRIILVVVTGARRVEITPKKNRSE
jgi:hypothetical protein